MFVLSLNTQEYSLNATFMDLHELWSLPECKKLKLAIVSTIQVTFEI